VTRKEVTKRAIEFRYPPYVPIWDKDGFGKRFLNFLDSDIVGVKYASSNKFEIGPGSSGMDEWGCIWKSLDNSIGMVVGHPISKWDDLSKYKFPNPNSKGRFDKVIEEVKELKKKEVYILGYVPFTLWERIYSLRGFSNALMDVMINAEKMEELIERVLCFQLGIVRRYGEIGVDGVFFTDDWGTSENLFINPKVWRNLFKDKYRRLFSTAAEYGMSSFLHSDGNIIEIIPDFIDCGCDVINLEAPQVFKSEKSDKTGIMLLEEKFKGKICFSCTVDMKTTLVKGTREDVVKEVKQLIKHLGDSRGGLIGTGSGYEGLNIDPQKIKVMFRAFREYGKLS